MSSSEEEGTRRGLLSLLVLLDLRVRFRFLTTSSSLEDWRCIRCEGFSDTSVTSS